MRCEAVHPQLDLQCELDGPHDHHAVFTSGWVTWPNEDYRPLPEPDKRAKRGSKLAAMVRALNEPKVQNSTNAQDTSLIAGGIELPASAQHRRDIYSLLLSTAGGCTDDEIGMWLALNPNTVRPRRGELVDGGLVMDSGIKRLSSMGNPAIVWEAIPVGAPMSSRKA